MLSYEIETAADPDRVWDLIARPSDWHRWAPHLRGGVGLGGPEVEAGRHGFVRLIGLIPVPARITGKEPGRRWTWQVGPTAFSHGVEPSARGARVRMTIEAPAPLEKALGVTYGPVISLLLRNLRRAAEQPIRAAA